MILVKKAFNLMKRVFNLYFRKSYSQSGEDCVIDYIFYQLGVEKPSYLDVGAHHAAWLSNTYYFYNKGCSGVCVEPDPYLYERIKKKRTRDVCLNVGVGLLGVQQAEFFVMSEKTLNTFSRKDAESCLEHYESCRIVKTIQVELLPINDIIDKYFNDCPNIISIDVEGIDFDILKSINYEIYRPEVICIETIEYCKNRSLRKVEEIGLFMKEKGYFVYADTFINTIFVDRKAWTDKSLPNLLNF